MLPCTRAVAGAIAVIVLATACSSSTPATQPASQQTASEDFDSIVLTELRSDFRAWNRTSAILLSRYLDDSVAADEYVFDSLPILEDLERIVAAMHGRDTSALPPGLAATVAEVIESYDDKLSAYNRITTAVAVGDVDGEHAAAVALTRANDEGLRIACEMMALLEGTPEADQLAAEGIC